MKKRLVFIFIAAASTAFGIILFQVYWVYNSYKTGERNFKNTATNALVRSIETYQLQQNELPTSLKYKVPTLTFFRRTIPNRDAIALDSSKVLKRFNAEFLTVAIDKNNLQVVKAMVARLLSQQLHKPLNLDTLTHVFKGELKKENINIPFKLVILRNQLKIPPGEIAAVVNFYKSPVVVKAEVNSNSLLLAQNVMPALVSLVLILLSAGSLFYMGVVIKRQMQLDGIKNDFINNITHELRTPITILKSSNEAMAQFGAAADPEKLERYLKINTAVLDKLESNVDRVLEITGYEQGVKPANLQSVNLCLLITRVIERFNLYDSTIKLQYDIQSDHLVTDAFIIDTILSNLIDNAIKYGGAEVEIRIDVTALANGWQLQVADTGPGISAAHLPYIFDKFYRIQSGDLHDVKGYGLGLSYVKQLVNTLAGTIAVASKLNKGTTFTIQFPLNG
ncbi:sensor histidine kinase [Mucilaginibacter celer]|uniref:histidine kinase n=1 Tax=Mucilaginibacter celer TaxID=2305508 RepID=A0A494VK21_9SPHI|nr:HAMP domain-containing sensor histidine kinase [Mucilaginibacter celer]AYL95456.1 sensor histidine kinase [Mucilaginibacter celer]